MDRALLDDLVKNRLTAPSGTKCQLWTSRSSYKEAVISFAGHIASFFQKKLNVMAEKRFLRAALKMRGKVRLDTYHREYYPLVKKVLEEWEVSGKDRLFTVPLRQLSSASSPAASCPTEDVLLATRTFCLPRHSMGLGSRLVWICRFHPEGITSDQAFDSIPTMKTVYSELHWDIRTNLRGCRRTKEG